MTHPPVADYWSPLLGRGFDSGLEPGPLVFDGAAKFVALLTHSAGWPPRTEERVECQ